MLNLKTPTLEQFQGCLIGQALGDALGAVVEGRSPDDCRYYVNEMLKKGQAGVIGRGSFQFGQYTDDTQLARELLQSYLSCGRFDPADYANRIAAIFTENRIVGKGRATEAAALRIAQGVPWQQAGTPPPSAGNGSAMRAGPVGLLFYHDFSLLSQVAYEQGYITHQDPRCSAGAIVISGAVALALVEKPLDRGVFLNRLSTLAAAYDQNFSSLVLKLQEWVSLPVDKAAEKIIQAGKATGPDDGWWGISPYVVPSVLWSLYAFLKTPEDYWETLCTAIISGGDVDTTAAMAGAISGAYLGIKALPLELARRLNDRGTWGYAELLGLADKCYERVIQKS